MCPPGTDDDTTQLCSANYTAEHMFILPLVKSLSTKLIYRNKFCAQCHNDTHIQSWSPSIDCYNKAIDLNYLNSYDGIFSKADKNNCSIEYNELNDTASTITCDSPMNRIGVCNFTGTWKYYDADIEMACSLSLGKPTSTHRNIFCQMCNPPEQVDTGYKVITGRASNTIVEGDPIVDACYQYEEIPLLHPYRNVFCYFLSMRNENIEQEIDFNEHVEIVNDTFKYYVELFILKILPLPIYDPSSEMRHSVGDYLTSLVNNQGNNVDVDHLLHLHFLHYGLQQRCSVKVNITGTDETFVQNCECDIDCIYSQTCCADFALSKPISLVSSFGQPKFLIDRCYGQSSGNITKLCEGDGDENDVISSIPIPYHRKKF